MLTPGLVTGVFILLSRGHLKKKLSTENYLLSTNNMISVTRINGKRFVINAELIRFIESTPDTMITMISGDKVMVKETIEEVVEKAVDYARQVRVFAVK